MPSRLGALAQAGFPNLKHELIAWPLAWDTAGIRGLYGDVLADPQPRRSAARRSWTRSRVAEHEFGGRVERMLTTSLYTARKPF